MTTVQPVLIAGAWEQATAPAGVFRAVDPATQEELDTYPVSGLADVERAFAAAREAVLALRAGTPEQRADFLEAYAAGIETRADALVDLAHRETALPREPRLRNTELPRTTDQLRQAAAAARERSWAHPTIDTRNNIRSLYGPLDGPVVVFGPNNFPFAFNSIAGGDFATAIAAGNPVIAKANPGHPGTTRLLAEAAVEALQATGLHPATVQLLYRTDLAIGLRLVAHPLLGATGFTGSRAAGLRLKAAAEAANKPIYLEMSSINPVFILPGVLAERLPDVARELSASCLLGAGQFCTNPGLVVLLAGAAGEAFLAAVRAGITAAPPGVLLSAGGPRQLAAALGVLQKAGAEVVAGGHAVDDRPGFRFENTLLRVAGDTFLRAPAALQTEAFGSASLFVFAHDADQLLEIADHLEGSLTAAVYSARDGADDALYARLAPALRPKVGRLLDDKMPTGVTVSPAMVHGGPPPATGHAGFTAVGIPAALVRFAALYCYDNVRPARLPPELQDRNPTGRTWRLIDGAWTQRDL